jgi:ABC-type lipoprotein export system ATPase subunit
MIFQSFNLLSTLSVLENVCLPALLADKDPEATCRKALELLDWLGLKNRREHHPDQLSGGEMQRTAIARALINDPALVLADEPTGNLDSRSGEEIMNLLHQLHAKGATIVMVTHDPKIAAHTQRTIHLLDGLVDNVVHNGHARMEMQGETV